MKNILFFLPFWWDHVYSDFDPWNDTYTPDDEHLKFLWDLDSKVPVDGILFSRTVMENSKNRLEKIKNAGGIRNLLKIPKELPLFGDCGAFSYIKMDTPPYDPLETVDFYEKMQYNLGCTIDHLIVRATEEQKHKRLDITLNNAEKMMDKWNSGDYSYTLIGVAQGWDPLSYRNSVEHLIDMNFSYIAFGGLVRSQSKDIFKVLKTCYPLWRRKEVKIHIFGIARLNLFLEFQKFHITSFDNAYHRKAWLSTDKNYELNGKYYSALRIPLSGRKANERIFEEQQIFNVISEYCKNKAEHEDVIKALKRYEEKLVDLGKEKSNRFERIKNLKINYLRTLKEKPWENCDCPICAEYGIHVCIFRTNNRNMRRGFHNLFEFYKRLRRIHEGKIKVEKHKSTRIKKINEIPTDKLKNKNTSLILTINNPEILKKADIKTPQDSILILSKKLCEITKWDIVLFSSKLGMFYADETFGKHEYLNISNRTLKTKSETDILLEITKFILENEKNLLLTTQVEFEFLKKYLDNTFQVIIVRDENEIRQKLENFISRLPVSILNYFS